MDTFRRLFPLTLIALLIFTLLLRLPSFIEPYWYGDEGVTLTVGQGIRAGMDLYKDIHDNKPPLLYWVAAAFPTLMQLKVATAFGVLIAVGFFYHLALKLTGKKGAILGTLVFSILSSVPLMEGNIVNGEIWQIIFVVAAFWLFFKNCHCEDLPNRQGRGNLSSNTIFFSGFLFGMGFLFKQPVVFDAAALGVFLVPKSLKELKHLKSLIFLGVGFLFPLALVSLYFLSQGTFSHFISDAFIQNSRYANAYNDFIIPQGKLYLRMLAGLGIVGLAISLFRKQPVLLFVAVLFTFETMGAFLTGRPYMHYLLGVVPSMSLGAAVLVQRKFWSKRLAVFALIAVVVLHYTITFFYKDQQMRRRTWFYYKHSASFMTGTMNQTDFHTFFDSITPYRYEVVNFLRPKLSSQPDNQITGQPDNHLLVWADDTLIYPMLNKQPQLGYIAAYHVSFYDAFDDLTDILRTTPPRFIVTEKPERHPYPFLQEYLATSAKEVFSNDYYSVYEVVSVSPSSN